MIERRPVPNRFRRFHLPILLMLVPMITLFGGVWISMHHYGWSWITILLVALCMVMGVLGLRFQNRLATHLKCPQCLRLLVHPGWDGLPEGTPIDFVCPDCGIEWITGISVPSSPS